MLNIHVSYGVTDDCKNLEESYGEICVRCNKCGRFDEEKAENDKEEIKTPKAAEFYSKELLDLANEPPSAEELERLRKEIEEWESRTNKFYRSSEDE